MERVTLLNGLLLILTWADGVLALALAVFLVMRASPYRHLVPPRAYRWAPTVGLLFSLGWWALLFCCLHASQPREGSEDITAFQAYVILPPSILGAEAGVVGFLGLPKLWGTCFLIFGVLSGLLALVVSGAVIGVRVFH